MKLNSYIFLVLMALPVLLSGQQADQDDDHWDEILESVLSLQDNDASQEDIGNSLIQLHENPVDLNSADRSDFSIFFFLTFSQIDSLLSYRAHHGKFLSVRELNYIYGFDENSVRMLLPFVTVQPGHASQKRKQGNWITGSKKSFLTKIYRNLEIPSGYRSVNPIGSKYLGSPMRMLNRLNITLTDRFSMGITSEKDPGEPLIWAPARDYYGFDHYSYYGSIINRGKLKNLTIGDYKLQFGQGLVLGNGFYLGKSSETIAAVDNKAFGIRPYGGSGESHYFHGSAFNFRVSHFDITGFFSDQKIDTRTDSVWGEEILTRSISETGLHRTRDEIGRRKNNSELSAGGHVDYFNKPHNFELGATVAYTFFSLPYEEDAKYYNQFGFRGKDLITSGIDCRYYHRKFSVFGEIASSGNYKWGIVNGIIGNLSKNVETALHIRYYSPSFYTLYGNPLREASQPGNESGIYWGLKIIPFKRIILNMYMDTFRFPWLKYDLRRPTSGYEIFSGINYETWRNMAISLQYRQKTMDAADQVGVGKIINVLPGQKRVVRMQWGINSQQGLQLKSRIQYSDYKISGNITRGLAAFQDLGWKANRFSLLGSIAWFKTDDFINRQYFYEHGALYDFQIPSYNGEGFKIYVLVNLKAGRHLHFWIKTGKTFYRNVNSIGTGTEEIQGNHKTDLLVQAEYNF